MFHSKDLDDYVTIEDLVKKGSKVRLLLKCNGIWIANDKFGCTWRAEQMKITPVENFDDYAFDDSDDDEEVEKINGNFVSSDEDSENENVSDSDSEEEEPVVAEKPKKRKVKKTN